MTVGPESRGFYVGYRSLPRRHAVFLALMVPPLALSVALFAAAITALQRDPGTGEWQAGLAQRWEGTLIADPYPMLFTEAGEEYLLVELGKRGPRSDIGVHHGRRVRVEGWLLERDGRRMIELAPESEAITPLAGGPRRVPEHEGLGSVALRGEIVDSKCYLGAMKPGDGKAHKACATLCVEGGIPPMLVATGPDGTLRFILLTDSARSRANALVLPFIAEPVEVEGTLARTGSTLSLAVERVRRISE